MEATALFKTSQQFAAHLRALHEDRHQRKLEVRAQDHKRLRLTAAERRELQELGDTTEDWFVRARWLEELISELWRHRGLLPGMPAVLELLSLQDAIPLFKQKELAGKEVETRDALFALVEGKADKVSSLKLDAADIKSVRRQWKLRTKDEQRLLREVLPRFALRDDQLLKILNEGRVQNSITAGLVATADNPYILSEQYQGNDSMRANLGGCQR